MNEKYLYKQLFIADKDSLELDQYFAAIRQEYLFGCMDAFVHASDNSSIQHLVYQDIMQFLASLVIVAQNLLSDHYSLHNLFRILVHLLEGNEGHACHCSAISALLASSAKSY